MYILYKVKLSKFNNFYRIEPDIQYKNMGAETFTVKADDPCCIKKFLRKCHAADSTDNPRSKRFLTYDEIINSLGQSGFDLYIFKHRYPKTQDDFNKIIGEVN